MAATSCTGWNPLTSVRTVRCATLAPDFRLRRWLTTLPAPRPTNAVVGQAAAVAVVVPGPKVVAAKVVAVTVVAVTAVAAKQGVSGFA